MMHPETWDGLRRSSSEGEDVARQDQHSRESTQSSAQDLTRNVLLASLIASLGAMSAGTVMAYPSPAVHSINTAEYSPFRVNKDEQSWFGSIFALGALLGAFSSGLLMDTVGRKLAIMIATVPFVAGWTVEAGASNVKILCAGRLLTGLCKGVLVGTSHVYTAETATSFHRGKLLSAASVANVLGTMCVYALGVVLPWTWLAIACAVIPTAMACLIVAMPETPRYLLLKKNVDEARSVLQWLRGPSADVSEELREMDDSIKDGRDRATFKEFFEPQLLRPLLIVLAMFTIQEFSGNSVLRVYTASIFESAGDALDPQVQSIFLGAFGVLGTLVSLMTIDRLGRRTLLVISSILMATCLTVTGIYFKIREDVQANGGHFDDRSLSWIPLVSLVVNNFSFALAYDPIPWMIASELFPTRARGIGNSLGGAWQGICFFLVTKFFQDVSDSLHVYGAFWIGASVCVVGAVFAVTVLPETKKRTLENIEHTFTVQGVPVHVVVQR